MQNSRSKADAAEIAAKLHSLTDAEGMAKQAPRKTRRRKSPAIARKMFRLLDQLDALAEKLARMPDNCFDHDDYVCSVSHAEAAVLHAVGWKKNYETGEITRRAAE